MFDRDIVIGLEIHVELGTDSKLFCPCPTKGSEEPNSRTCEVCLGMPGARPVVNNKAIGFGIRLGLALGCEIAGKVIFSRKSYFYPDLAKDYQITQYEWPLGQGGGLAVLWKDIRIKRIHLEEDPAALVHPSGIGSSKLVMIDYNRSGNPLVEVVTEPDLSSPEEAREFMRHLTTILEYLGIFDPRENIIKADANISIRESGYVRSEIKNITGYREIERALSYEIERQRQAVREGLFLKQETRSWDPVRGVTHHLRTKETEDDYGYITDPDLVPVPVTDDMLRTAKESLPELPPEKIQRYMSSGVSPDDAAVIASEPALANIFEKLTVKPELASRWIRRELVRVLNYNNIELHDISVDAVQLDVLLKLVESQVISEKTGQRLIEKLALESFDVEAYVRQEGLQQIRDSGEIESMVDSAIRENPKAVTDYLSGNQNSLNFLVGQVMRLSKGKADPAKVRELMQKKVR